MKIYNIIDSLELNGGSTMFLEMTAGMKKYWVGDEIIPCVVSKTGEMGRNKLIDASFASSYGVDINIYDYIKFQTEVVPYIKNAVIFHHVLGYTKNIEFDKSCKYIVINHSIMNLHRLPAFNAHKIICVSNFFRKQFIKAMNTHGLGLTPDPVVVLNGCEDYYCPIRQKTEEALILGTCQRIVPSKFFDEKLKNDSIIKYIIGPIGIKQDALPKNAKIFGAIFDRNRKIDIMRNFDIYLHAAKRPEGCSMAILEALSCGVPIIARDVGGGVNDIIHHEQNGFLYSTNKEFKKIISSLLKHPDKLQVMKENAHKDFLSRFHITHMLDKYKNIVNKIKC